jgi:hypothetical protein
MCNQTPLDKIPQFRHQTQHKHVDHLLSLPSHLDNSIQGLTTTKSIPFNYTMWSLIQKAWQNRRMQCAGVAKSFASVPCQ